MARTETQPGKDPQSDGADAAAFLAPGDGETDPEAAADGEDLVLTSVTKRFAGFTAVDDLDLTVPQGSFFALLGPSGCGKTTTLRMVAGLERPTEGEIKLGDSDITGLSRTGDRSTRCSRATRSSRT